MKKALQFVELLTAIVGIIITIGSFIFDINNSNTDESQEESKSIVIDVGDGAVYVNNIKTDNGGKTFINSEVIDESYQSIETGISSRTVCFLLISVIAGIFFIISIIAFA